LTITGINWLQVMPVEIVMFLVVGLLLFLGGLKLMSGGLEAMCGNTFAETVRRLTGNRFSAFLCGLAFAGLTQSSSLATVIVVGVVDARIIGLGAAIAVIIGANVGTTVTGQLISFQLYDYAQVFAGLGILFLFSSSGTARNAGRALLGLGLLLFGLRTMTSALVPVFHADWVENLMRETAIHPAAGIFTGALLTALVQSSSAVVGIAIALAGEGALTLASGAAIIVGADVGTCVTSLLAGLGTGLAARRAAIAHLMFNVFSVLIVLPVFSSFIMLAARTADVLPRQLANAHTIYNLSGAILLMILLTPFQTLVERVCAAENPDKKRIFSVLGELLARWF
jgi:phosphate:Na+ symporter